MIDAPDRPVASDSGLEPEAGATPKKRGGGPKTAAGKESSKRNSLRHGLMARVVLPDDLAAAAAERTAELAAEFLPGSPYEAWLVGEMARAIAKIDRCAELTIVDLQRSIDRAALCWDGDRRAYIEDLGARLPKDPARVARALGATKQGCDWLLERWEGLGEVLQSNGAWDERQRRLAFDLLGVPDELRDGSRKVPPACDAPALAALVAAQVDRLGEEQEATLNALDEATQALAAAGMAIEEDAATRRLRRYEASARRELRWSLAELRRVRAEFPGAGEFPASSSSSSSSSRPDASSAPAERPLANGAAMDFLVKRAQLLYPPIPETPPDEPTTASDTATETPPVPADVSTVVVAPAVAEPPAAAEAPDAFQPPSRVASSRSLSTSSTPTARNRRERRAQEKRARQAARSGVR
jgi:hypothetical protein